MKYQDVIEATFISRPNRFVARVLVNGREETVHVKNTGRCRELLIPGCRIYLSVSDRVSRKTKYDLIAVEKAREGSAPLLINMDSQIPNDAAAEWLQRGELFSKSAHIRREARYGNSRFDFYVEDGTRKAFLEVKGVTLEEDGVARFPDAPTERGVKHVEELIDCLSKGYEAYILFVIQMKGVTRLEPNDSMHRAFGDALRAAAQQGVHVMAMDCAVAPDSIEISCPIPIKL